MQHLGSCVLNDAIRNLKSEEHVDVIVRSKEKDCKNINIENKIEITTKISNDFITKD